MVCIAKVHCNNCGELLRKREWIVNKSNISGSGSSSSKLIQAIKKENPGGIKKIKKIFDNLVF